MLLSIASDNRFFGDAPWWVFPLVGIPMMLIMMLGMGLMMWVMMRMMMGMGDHDGSHGMTDPEEDPALDIARRRYARGEITREQFEQLQRDLS